MNATNTEPSVKSRFTVAQIEDANVDMDDLIGQVSDKKVAMWLRAFGDLGAVASESWTAAEAEIIDLALNELGVR
jgi:hypothetical protein